MLTLALVRDLEAISLYSTYQAFLSWWCGPISGIISHICIDIEWGYGPHYLQEPSTDEDQAWIWFSLTATLVSCQCQCPAKLWTGTTSHACAISPIFSAYCNFYSRMQSTSWFNYHSDTVQALKFSQNDLCTRVPSLGPRSTKVELPFVQYYEDSCVFFPTQDILTSTSGIYSGDGSKLQLFERPWPAATRLRVGDETANREVGKQY